MNHTAISTNKRNLSKYKLGIARYLASKEFQSLHGQPSNNFISSPKSPRIDKLPEIPEEGETNVISGYGPRRQSTFMAVPNYNFGMPTAGALSFKSNSTLEEAKSLSVDSVTTENMSTPLGPKKQNKCPRKTSSSTISTQDSNVKKRNRLGSIEEEIKSHLIFLSPQAPRVAEKRRSQ
jgi:hypothetical protein